MMKIGLSVLATPEAQVHALLRQLKTYGLESAAHLWQDDLAAMAWLDPKATLVKADCALWAIMGSMPLRSSHKPRAAQPISGRGRNHRRSRQAVLRNAGRDLGRQFCIWTGNDPLRSPAPQGWG